MADNPLINGHRYGWASVEACISGHTAKDFTEISYLSKLDPGVARGFGMRKLGRTRGEGDHEGSISLLKSEAQKFITAIGAGFMLVSFDIIVSYEEPGEGGCITDQLIGCRITSMEDNPKQGSEPLSVKFDLDIMRVYYNGVDPFKDKP